MDIYGNNDRPRVLGRLSRFSGTGGMLLGGLPAPLLHAAHGSSGFWDGIISVGLIAAVMVVLGALLFLGRRRRGNRRDE